MTEIVDDAPNVDFYTLAKGEDFSQSVQPGLWAAKTEDSWRWHWRQLRSDPGDVQDATAVDWAKEMIIILSLGFRMTAGYRVDIERLVLRGDVLDVYAREGRAGPNRATLQVITSPYHVVACARSDRPLRLIQRIDEH
jgi:hypothetical protein